MRSDLHEIERPPKARATNRICQRSMDGYRCGESYARRDLGWEPCPHAFGGDSIAELLSSSTAKSL